MLNDKMMAKIEKLSKMVENKELTEEQAKIEIERINRINKQKDNDDNIKENALDVLNNNQNKNYYNRNNKSFEELNIIEKHILINKLLEQENKSIHNFSNAVFITRKDGDTLVQKASSVWDFKVLFYLYKFHKQGIVKDVTMKDIAKFYGQENIRHIIQAIKNLESLEIITVDRNIKPYQYVILNYNQNKKKDGLFAVPEQFMEENKITKLKYFRASWYYMAHNHHDPYNQNSLDLSLNTLKGIINAQSYEEVKKVLQELLGNFFEDISFEDEQATQKKRERKGLNLVSVVFNKVKLGIIEGISLADTLANHQLFEKIGTAMIRMDINFTVPNLFKAITTINKNFSEFILDKLITKIDKENLKSKYKTVKYLLKMLEVVEQELSQPNSI